MIDLDEPLPNAENERESQSGHPRAVFVLGAGFSRAISSEMPCTDQLGAQIGQALEIPSKLTRGKSFEDWLSRLAEPQPDQSIENNLLRQSYFQTITCQIVSELETAQAKALSNGLPSWLYKLITVAHFWQSTLISFNYDTLIERNTPVCLLQMPNPVQLPATIPLSSGDVVGQMPPLPNRPSRAPFPTFRLLKLHGSLAWFWVFGDTTGSTIARSPIDDEEIRATTIIETRSGVLGKSTQMVAEPAEDPLNRQARLLPDRSRFIAPPSGPKSSYYQNPFMTQLWKNARLALENADEVYFVGYSMPAADSTARGLFRESIRPDAKIIIVNPCPKPIYDQITEWGFKVDEVLSEQNCVEKMVEMLEDRRGKEALPRLKKRFLAGDVDQTRNPDASVIPAGIPNGIQRVKYVEVRGNSLILEVSSEKDGGMTISQLFDLIENDSIQDIRICSAGSEQRMIHYEFEWNLYGTEAKIPLALSLRVATLPGSSVTQE